jgi:TRAP-type C4-dicarboxylate transport system permease small subunit
MLKGFYFIVYFASMTIPVSLFMQVIFRYFLRSPIAGVEEFATAAFVWLVVFGSAILFKEKNYIVVDFLVKNRKGAVRKTVTIIDDLLMIIILAVVFYSCYIALPYQSFYKTVVLKIPSTAHTIALMISFAFMFACCVEDIIKELSRGGTVGGQEILR